MEFRLLGPFEARHDGDLAEVGSRRQERCLLAILLLAAGQTVPVSRILDLLWDGDPPETARNAVYTYVGRLRNTLSRPRVRIATRHDGYLLEADRHWIDVVEFTALARRAVGVRDPFHRARLLDQALGLWRGPLLADVAGQQLRDRLGAELLELRLASCELRAEAQLEIGQHDRVASDLAPLIETDPTRERLVAAHMTALHRCGRPADALRLYRDTRRLLVDELGIEPGTKLQTLHQKILSNDPRLEPRARPVYEVRLRGQELPWAVGGHPALEFCNTYAGWGQPPEPGAEWLRSYATFAVWAGYTGLADDRTVSQLLEAAQRSPDEAATVLDEARTLRTHLYACLTRPYDVDSFQAVAEFVEEAAKVARFGPGEDGLAGWIVPLSCGVRQPLHAAARAAGELLADPRRRTIRACPSKRCGWLFLDRTGMRRWCSTATCGDPAGCHDAVG